MTIEEALNTLPKTPEEIREFLLDSGCRGKSNSAWCCPLAKYLNLLLGGAVLVSNAEVWGEGTSDWFPLPNHVLNFRVNFDCGDYPELEE